MVSLFRNNFFKKLNNNWIFEYIIVLLYIGIGILGWTYEYRYAGMGIVGLSLILLFIFNDFKYIIPAGITVIFSYNVGFETQEMPIEIACYGGALIAIILIYSIINFKLSNFKKPKSYIGIVLLAISCIIPIFWNNVITEETKLLYFIYFTWVLYVVVYFVFGINLGKNALRVAIFTFSSLVILISYECFRQVREMVANNPGVNPLSMWYYLGWGLCNEAGIMLCFSMPFIFYEMIKTENPIVSALAVVKLSICVVGIVLTTSRGAFLFGSIELGLLLLLMLIFSKKRITNVVFVLLFAALAVLYVHLNYGVEKVYNDIKEYIFYNNLDDNGRKALWETATNLWNQDTITKIFGSGIVSELENRHSFNGTDNVFIVYHSTFYEMLVVGGIFGVAMLAVHFFEKYFQLFKKELPFVFVMLVGYLVVDAYGMVDNTYGMYYYMVPLVILMAALDCDKNTDIFKKVEI